jgi:hypothetical protein
LFAKTKRGDIVKQILVVFFTLVTFIFSNEIQTAYGRIIDTEPVSHYLKMTESYIKRTGIETFIQKELVQRYSLTTLGDLPLLEESIVKQQITDKLTLAAGDTGITDNELTDYSAIIKEISLPTIKSKLDLVPVKNINITLFTTTEYYGQALLRAGITSTDVTSIVKNSGGITLNSSIWIPLYNLEGKGGIANALTHELTHVTLNQAGIARKLPLWLNEGTAWVTGLAAHERVNPLQAKVEAVVLKESVQNLAQKGKRLPLDNTEQGLYYIEAQGYLATEALIKKYGLETFKAFLKQTMNKEVNRSFDLTFKMPLQDYENSFKP